MVLLVEMQLSLGLFLRQLWPASSGHLQVELWLNSREGLLAVSLSTVGSLVRFFNSDLIQIECLRGVLI